MSENEFIDPKIQLILSIKQHDEEIIFYVKNNRFLEAAKAIHLLLDRLDISEEPEDNIMRELRDTITINTYNQMTIEDIDFALAEIHKFLNRTYYKGFSNNRPATKARSLGDLQRTVDVAKHQAGL